MAAAKVHRFLSTAAAYDACQCDDAVRDGDILLVESEQVIGLAATWPVAVTEAHGHLHTVGAAVSSLLGMAEDMHWSHEDIRMAVRTADDSGWPVRPLFRSI